MSVLIIGGNECMTRRYIDLCESYSCKAKVYPKMKNGIKDIGSPDLLVFFTNTMSHKMLECVKNNVNSSKTQIVHCHSSSVTALKGILDLHVR